MGPRHQHHPGKPVAERRFFYFGVAALVILLAPIIILYFRSPASDYDAEDMHAMALMELRMRRLMQLSNMSESNSICRDLQARGIVDPRRQDVAWITAVGDDNYLKPIIVLATTLELYSCVKRRLVLLSPVVSKAVEAKLVRMHFEPIRVEKDYFCENGKLDPSRWHGTFLRFSAFSLTQFTKLLYVDGDFMLLSNIDDVFEYARHPKEVVRICTLCSEQFCATPPTHTGMIKAQLILPFFFCLLNKLVRSRRRSLSGP
jgi:hypothetical protein